MKKLIISVALAIISAATMGAQDKALWIRKSSISPDGSTIAFSWQGDIFTVPVTGGQARQITSNAAYESDPLWTPDGLKIVFSSTREGSKDIFIIPVMGGTPERLTKYSGSEVPICVTPEGKVLYQTNIETSGAYMGYPGDPQLYSVSIEGGPSSRVTSMPVNAISVASNGTILYEDDKGYEDALRKHHTSSVTRDIWLLKAGAGAEWADGSFTKLTSFKGEDRCPVFAADGKTFYYLSEQGGNFNVWRSSIDAPASAVQLTSLPIHPVRYLSVASNGTMVFSYNGELYSFKEGSEPVKLEISVTKDLSHNKTVRRRVSGGARDLSISPNGKEIAVVARGDVFVTSVEYGSTRRITETFGQERRVSFSEDGRSIYYDSERDGHWGIYRTSLKNKKDKYFTYSFDFEEEAFSPAGETCFQPMVSPDGKWVAYLRDRTELVIRSTKGDKEKSLLKGTNYSYQDGDQDFSWSPDSQYILINYQANGGWNNEDVAVVEIETGKVTNLTNSGYSDGSFRWAMKGHAMTWTSDKAGYRSHGSWGAERDIYAMFFDGETMYKFTRDKESDAIDKLLADDKKAKKEEKEKKAEADSTDKKKKVEKLELDFSSIEDRIVRLTPGSNMIGDHYLTDDGAKLFFVTRHDNKMDLCEMDMKTRAIKIVEKGVSGGFLPSPDGKFLFVVSGSGIKRMPIAGGPAKPVTFSDDYEFCPADERNYIFEHCWKQVKEKFYDVNLHGVDWDLMHDNYASFLPYIDNNFDFQELLSELLGELNASHTGGRYRTMPTLNTGHLGVIFDEDWAGKGLKVQEVLPGGVLSLVYPELKAGDIISHIDGKEIEAGSAWYEVLHMKAGKRVSLRIGKKDILVKPNSGDSQGLYKRWVRRNEKIVEELSGGRVGYVHVQGMNSPSFRETYSKLLGKYRTCDAVIVDTRHNGGGWLHDDLATLLSGSAYIEFRPRGQYIGTEPYSKWNKPSCVLIGEDNYSDACGFPYVYKTLGIGKLIGAPVPGTMTAVWWETQIDPTIVFGIPQVTSWGLKEDRALENLQIEPDILVYNDPASMLSGEDKQLEAAVKEMLSEISAK